jgi:hypothetical protein
MSISGKQTINIGLPNESTGSDSLRDAFTKTKVNFDTLFACASPFSTFIPGDGIGIASDSGAGTVTITNAGVTQLNAGTGIILSGSNGNVTISSTGGSGNGGGTVTSVAVLPVSTARLTTSGSPVVSSGNIFLDLATSGVTAGTYSNPTFTVDPYGRVTSAANGAASGTVTSVGLTPGSGIQISGGPITSNGNITVTNTGVTRLTAGSGIAFSSGNGNVTISATSLGGTVTSVGISSSQLVVSGSPVVSSGTISVNLPNNATFTGNVDAGNIRTDNLLYANGTPWDLQEAAGSNNQIQYNSGNNFSASANLTFDPVTRILNVIGNVATSNLTANTANINGDLTVIGDITYNPTYGCFHKTANVTAAAANTVYAFDWYANTTAHVGNQGVTVTSGQPTRINIDKNGDYSIFVEMQVVNIDANDRTAWLWLSKNGTDVAQSTVRFTLLKTSSQLIAKQWVLDDINANDYIEVKFAVDNTSGLTLEYVAAQSSPFIRPAQPSATIAITPVGA